MFNVNWVMRRIEAHKLSQWLALCSCVRIKYVGVVKLVVMCRDQIKILIETITSRMLHFGCVERRHLRELHATLGGVPVAKANVIYGGSHARGKDDGAVFKSEVPALRPNPANVILHGIPIVQL